MGNLKQKPTKQTEPVSNIELEPAPTATTRRKKAGRPRKKPATKPEAGTGGSSLSCAIDSWVIDHKEQLAEALGNHALKSTSGVKLLADLVGAKASQAKPAKKHPGLTLAQRLALAPPWEGPPLGSEFDHPLPKQPS